MKAGKKTMEVAEPVEVTEADEAKKWPRMYIGPTIPGVATRNSIYAEMPPGLALAAAEFTWLPSTMIGISSVSIAIREIQDESGAYFNLYRKACENSADIQLAAHKGG